MTSLAADVARLRQVLARQDGGPAIVAGHSYGGQIITALGADAPNVDPVRARVMWAVQQSLSAPALQEVMGVPAWKSLPSWFLVAAGDQAIPPEAERQFAARMGATTVEVPSNHVAMVSRPQDVLALIQTAAQAAQA